MYCHMFNFLGNNTGYLHWQLLAAFTKKCRLASVKRIFGSSCHAEPGRSDAAREYVWKEDTRVQGTQFELGQLAIRRNNDKDWDGIFDLAKSGRLVDIPKDVLIRHYGSLTRISTDFVSPVGIERSVFVFWGATGTGKSRRAWEEAGLESYPKDPCTKWWSGYRGQAHVVIDEFRGAIGISHILRWTDRYPVVVEIKGGAVVLEATKIWITSNLHPNDWYPDLDAETKAALMRRLNITHFDSLN